MYRLSLALFVFATLLKATQSSSHSTRTESEEVLQFCRNNGKDFLTITTMDLDDPNVRFCELHKYLNNVPLLCY